MAELPSGTVTFLFSDLEVSTRLWEQHHDAMVAARARYFEIVDGAVERSGGVVFSHAGDGVAAAFASAPAALRGAVAAQRGLAEEPWGETGSLVARMALHTGEGVVVGEDQYDSQPLNRCARLMGVAHGGQLLVSGATAALVTDALVDGVGLSDLGEHRLRDLARPMHVHQVHAPGLRARFPPLASVDAFPGNLPLQTSSFIGRAREMERTRTALEEARVVTLTGVGGVGKTRLALQVAADVLPSFREGAWLVELAPVRDPDDVVNVFTTALGVTTRGGPTTAQALTDVLHSKQLLLVVDNCEHLIDAVADLADEVVRRCPRVTLLATSREGLALEGERIIAVPTLAAPDVDADLAAVSGSEAVQLFVERAIEVDGDFVLDRENAAAVAQVCRRLDGVPLAIQLAAARVTSMTPAELASALDRRFDLLVSGRRGAVKRQQTLRAAIDWSYDLLDEAHRLLLARLAVFAGGWTREAAEVVCSGGPIEPRAVLGLLTDLVDRSLVVAQRGQPGTRYRVLETIREYSEERLAELGSTEELRDRHMRYYAEYAWRCGQGLRGPDQIEWGWRLAADRENLLAAFARAVDTEDVDAAVLMLESTPGIVNQVGDVVWIPAHQALTISGVEHHPGYPLVLLAAAYEAEPSGDAARVRELADAALEAEQALSGTHPYQLDLAQSRWFLEGLLEVAAGDWDAAAVAFLESVELARGSVAYGAATGLASAAAAHCFAGRFTDAIPLATEAVERARAARTPTSLLVATLSLAMAVSRDDPARARSLLEEVIASDTNTDNYGSGMQIAVAAATIGDWHLVASVAARSMRLLQWANHVPYTYAMLVLVARAVVERDPEAAASIQGAAHAVITRITATTGSPVKMQGGPVGGMSLTVDTRRATTSILAGALGDERLHALREEGSQMDLDSAVEYAVARLAVFLEEPPRPSPSPGVATAH